jgi:hypothetical protein
MCDCNKSSFFPYRETKLYSNFSDSQLRAQCAQENGLDANDPQNQYIIDACVAEKKKQPSNKGEKAIGWINMGSTVLGNLGNVLNGIFNPQPAPADYGTYPTQPKGISTGAIIGIVAGVVLLGVGIYYVSKPKGGK